MSMHLHHPSLSLNGKKKGKKTFRNAEEARLARELDESWKNLQKKWGVDTITKHRKPSPSITKTETTPAYRGADVPKPKSLSTWTTGAVSSKPSPKYTGTAVLGISTLHKSNAIPVFSKEEAIDISKMRR